MLSGKRPYKIDVLVIPRCEVHAAGLVMIELLLTASTAWPRLVQQRGRGDHTGTASPQR